MVTRLLFKEMMMDLKALESKMRKLSPENGDWEEAMSQAVDIMYEAIEIVATDYIAMPNSVNRSHLLELLDAFDDNFR